MYFTTCILEREISISSIILTFVHSDQSNMLRGAILSYASRFANVSTVNALQLLFTVCLTVDFEVLVRLSFILFCSL